MRTDLSCLCALAMALIAAACSSDTNGRGGDPTPPGDRSGAVDITPSGGEGCILAGKLCLEVPAGAVHEAVQVRVEVAEPTPTWALDTAFRLQPTDLLLLLPARATYRLDPAVAASVRGSHAWLGLTLPSGEGELLSRAGRDDDVLAGDVRRFGVLAPTADADRDGYPDVADLCPGSPDPDQRPCPPGDGPPLGRQGIGKCFVGRRAGAGPGGSSGGCSSGAAGCSSGAAGCSSGAAG